ncbi:FAD-binding protein [Pseudomonas aeruginosa]|uniref:FAD-binding protein n=1 Tax=Pseudomonas aeruginosa TaxID=287 RepID=UPI001FD11DBE|nr:FAD-binding protein [Pseudomonas aeruginosa]UOO66840.1 FAD-binding protein [Pseudomonas aeruginosa]
MIEIRSLRDLLRLLFIYQREFKLAALSAVVIIVLGAFLLPAKYESNARLLVKPGRDSTLPIEISNRQALVMPSTQRDPIVDEERLLTGRPIVRQVAERYLEVLANRPPPEGLWKRTKFYVKKAIGAVFDGIRVTLETFGVIEETTAVERLAKDLEKKFEVTHAAGSTVMEISFTWSEPEVAQEVVKAWIEIYMEERTQALGRKSLYAFYEAQTADSAAQIKSYKAQILKHLNEIGASSIEDRLQDLSERINVLRGERFNSIRLIASSDSALESTRQQLKGLPREIVTVRQIALNPAQQDLRRLLNQKRLERADMMRTYTDDAPPVKALDASIRALEKEVQDEGATVQSSEDRAPNTLTTHLERVLLDETSNNAALRSGYLKRGTSLDQLARSCGIDPSGLAATVAEYNRHAREGRDPEFGRGGTAFNRKQGDPAYPGPNPCVAPIERGPYYAVQVEPGCFGTFAGLKTDAQARVLDGGGQPIPGLYAAGADMASLFAGHYPSGGINLGPALTFGYIAGRHIAGALGYEQEQAQRG